MDWLDLTVATTLGVVTYSLTGDPYADRVRRAMGMGARIIALLFGGMVVARVLGPTGMGSRSLQRQLVAGVAHTVVHCLILRS